jgi:Protein of unknown function (DUF1569)
MKTLAKAEDIEEIRGRIGLLTPVDAPLWGSMSVGQMVCHLSDSFEVSMGERAASALKPPLPRPLVKWLALQAPMKWPKGVETVPELNQCKGAGTAPATFEADAARLLGKLESFAAASSLSVGLSATHPIFGAMTMAEWMRWGYLHCDHHLRQFGR